MFKNKVFSYGDDYLKQARDNLIDSFWNAQEAIDYFVLSTDLIQFKKADEKERLCIMGILYFFALGDEFIIDNISVESNSYINQKIANEDIHSETYKILFDKYYEAYEIELDEKLFTPFIENKINWIKKFFNEIDKDFIFLITEGVFFSGSFAIIFWFRDIQKKYKSITYANEFIARDEGEHVRVNLYLLEKNKPFLNHEEKYLSFTKEAVEIECALAEMLCPENLNKQSITNYIKFMADTYLNYLQLPLIYNITENPLPYMESLGLKRNTDFFRKKSTEYNTFKKGDWNNINWY